jgi:hypothetical protein
MSSQSYGGLTPEEAPTTSAQNFRITDDGGKLRATCATWDDAVRDPSRQEGGMTREKAVDLVMNAAVFSSPISALASRWLSPPILNRSTR